MTTTTASDEERMDEAIAVAATARRSVSPRPWVGAVVVTADGGRFAGATEGRDGPHAEVVALRAAGDAARGATLYVTLEPCSHHGRTGPCADAVDRGRHRPVRRRPSRTPTRKVAGQGIARLRDAGVEVEVGLRRRARSPSSSRPT